MNFFYFPIFMFFNLNSPGETCSLGMFDRSDSLRRALLAEELRLPFLKGMAPSPLAKARCEVAKLSFNASVLLIFLPMFFSDLMIAIIDYNAGNLKSISNAIAKLGETPLVTKKAEDFEKADKIILPGVGSFERSKELKEIKESLRIEIIKNRKPFFGICLGMQLLAKESEEKAGEGLGLLEQKVVKIKHAPKLPHMGWNNLKIVHEHPFLEGINEKDYFYFVHSYALPVATETIAITEYGEAFSSIIAKNNVFASQFHPEKSGEKGLLILKRFLKS